MPSIAMLILKNSWQTLVPLLLVLSRVPVVGPAYEYAFILDKALRDAQIRHKIPKTFVTSESYIGHLSLGGVGDSKSMLESELRHRNIKWVCNSRVDKVVDGMMHISELNRKGEVEFSYQESFNHSMLIPPFGGVPAVANVCVIPKDS